LLVLSDFMKEKSFFRFRLVINTLIWVIWWKV
jgi:hypothetical protein